MNNDDYILDEDGDKELSIKARLRLLTDERGFN